MSTRGILRISKPWIAGAAAVAVGSAAALAWRMLVDSSPNHGLATAAATATAETALAPSAASVPAAAIVTASTATVGSATTTVSALVRTTTTTPAPPLPEEARSEWLVLQGSGDIPGPLFGRSLPRMRHTGLEERPYDLCDLEDAKMTVAQRAPEPGEKLLLTLKEWDRFKQDRYGLGCDGTESIEGFDGRYAIVNLQSGLWQYFPTAERAVEWLNDGKAAHLEAHRNTVPPHTRPLGTVSSLRGATAPSGFTENIVFAEADSPVDEVQVLPESLAVRDGAVRGLVRNWSRTRWAYGVTVTADGSVWRWPLSVQPGETAPFEILGWDSSAVPDPASIAVTAEMSPYADLTRAFEFEWATPWSSKYEPEHKPTMPPEVEATFPAEEDYYGQLYRWRWVSGPVPPPAELWSHPSVNERLVGAEIEDLRAYIAYHQGGSGQVIGVERLHVIGFEEVIDRLPYFYSGSPDAPQYEVWITFDTPHDLYGDSDLYTVWLGGAHHPVPNE
ncbi:MAG: hypothetical protein F4021_06955 [Acidimicrobiales bacterium]|nr:hypothetical protein [Acidimicrobiales bacterium]MYK71419.1 hypothetical protein [Acidimicrobiales bacterium]